MKILIATDSFKDCLPADEVGKHLSKGIQKVFPKAEIKLLPVADGGEGTVPTLVDAAKGRLKNLKVHDPLGREIDSFYGILGDNNVAVIEMAAASGLELLDKKERNPWITTTIGTGELIKDALDKGCRKIIIGVGGSATNDGGAGMAVALGARLLDKSGKFVYPVGGELNRVHSIDLSEFDKRVASAIFIVACDVENPLTGPDGASIIYSPQKGADSHMAEKLDENLVHFSEKIRKILGKDISGLKGAGAAGGLGAGLFAFLSAELRPGFEIVKELVHLEKYVKWADLVITGEGKMDNQTQYGKAPYGVMKMAKKFEKAVIAVTGALGEDVDELYHQGFDCLFPITDRPMKSEESIRRAPELLTNAGERIMHLLRTGMLLR